jgi:hypothetical protein
VVRLEQAHHLATASALGPSGRGNHLKHQNFFEFILEAFLNFVKLGVREQTEANRLSVATLAAFGRDPKLATSAQDLARDHSQTSH